MGGIFVVGGSSVGCLIVCLGKLSLARELCMCITSPVVLNLES